MNIQKMVLFAITAAFLSLFLRQTKGEWGQWVSLFSGVILAFYCLSNMTKLKGIGSLFQNLAGKLQVPYLSSLWKAIGIAYLCEFAIDVCKETGNIVLAKQLEIGGKLAILMIAVPILLSLYEMLLQMGG